MQVKESLEAAARELDLAVTDSNDEIFRQMIIERVRELIHADFQKLVNILYRIDVSESRLKLLLEENPESDAGVIITDLIIERQAQKIKSRRDFKTNNDISEEEKW